MNRKRIGICAPSTPFSRDDAEAVISLAAKSHPEAELVFSDQCYASAGHFAGSDKLRCDTFVQMANDSSLDAIWFARGGYGAVRFAEHAVSQLKEPAHDKIYMGYSDGGNLLAALYKAGIGKQAHGPMPVDIRRDGGELAVKRALDWIISREGSALEPQIKSEQKYVAFNLTTLAMMVGTPLLPNLTEHILMVEEISEYLYAFDRAMCNVTSYFSQKNLGGLQLGHVTAVPENERPFGQSAEEITRFWCDRNEIAYLGRVEIGHDSNNHIVPFGKVTA